MKNKKLSILFEGMKKVCQHINSSNAPKKQYDPSKNPLNSFLSQQNSVKVNFEFQQNNITITALQINSLQNLFPQVCLQQAVKDFSEYLTLPSEILGKRSSKITISKSSKYLLKIVQQQDIVRIKSLFPALFDHYSNRKENCLVKIYFIFLLDYSIAGVKLTDRYILMPNIRGHFDTCIKTFDIKGHLEARSINHEDFIDFKFGKDENFVQSTELEQIRKGVNKTTLEQMVTQIIRNAEFLLQFEIIDYSLLFSIQYKSQSQNSGVNEVPCHQVSIDGDKILKWVIIDYFQVYNEKKKFQNKFKSIFRKTVSSVDPQTYFQRLVDFLQKYLLS